MNNKLKENIGFIEKIAYGSGDVGCNFIYVLVSTYITFFYTDALGLNAAIIGSIASYVYVAVTYNFVNTICYLLYSH